MKKPSVINQLKNEYRKKHFPSFPEKYYPPDKSKKQSATNAMMGAICDYINLQGYRADRINTQGNYIEGEEFENVLGQKMLTKGKWIPSGSTPGYPDIDATVNGRSVKIEVKRGRDKQSEEQKRFQEREERAGGIYYLATSFDEFKAWFDKTFKKSVEQEIFY